MIVHENDWDEESQSVLPTNEHFIDYNAKLFAIRKAFIELSRKMEEDDSLVLTTEDIADWKISLY